MFVLALTLTNCTEEIQQPLENTDTPEVVEPAGIPFELVASNTATKTSLDGLQTVWVADDAMNIFHAVAGSAEYVSDGSFTITSENLAANKFTGTLPAELTAEEYDWYAFYPYSKYNKTPAGVSSETFSYQKIAQAHNGSQTQNGNGSMAHLAGVNFPLYGKTTNVAKGDAVSMSMNHLVSVVEVTVTNNSGDALTVTDVTFTSEQEIVGTYYIDFTGNVVSYTPREYYVGKTATLIVENGAEIPDEGTAKFYLGVKPFTAASGTDLKISVNGYEKTLTLPRAVTFTAGKIKKIGFDYNPPPVTEQTVTFDFTNPTSLGLTPSEEKSTGIEIASPVESNNVTFTNVKAKLFTTSDETYQLRGYVDGSLTFSVPEGNVISKIVLDGSQITETYISPIYGTYSKIDSKWTWVGRSSSVVINTIKSTSYINSISVTYDLGTPKAEQTLSFSNTEYEASVGDSFTPPTLSGAVTEVTYSSSNTSVATVDASTGAVTLISGGTVVITATAEDTEDCYGASASYTITVSSQVGSKRIKVIIETYNTFKTEGDIPDDAEVKYNQTLNSKAKMEAGHSVTYTLTGFAGCTIKSVTLSMKSNKSAGAGSLSLKVGDTVLSEIADSKFNASSWNGVWSDSYVDKSLTLTNDSYIIQDEEDVVLKITASENSLYCQSMTIEYTTN